ncbi:Hypothetical protein A7982_08785 [Minicystis rosea]|nr:Hypothetical protein A7982_08785 [Minicystis rosea]
MGYFKPKRSRRREGALKSALRAGRIEGAAEVTPTEPFKEWRFVRLSVPAWYWSSGSSLGVFCVAGDVQDKMRLSDEQNRKLEATLRWFNKRLPVPSIADTRAIFWFKLSAAECRRRVTHLARHLRALGVEVVVTETSTPGHVVYEDAFQIAAIPPPPDTDAETGNLETDTGAQ